MDEEQLKGRLVELTEEHRDLDDAITALERAGTFDALQVQRMKKRKLWLRDEIQQVNSLLVPDIIA